MVEQQELSEQKSIAGIPWRENVEAFDPSSRGWIVSSCRTEQSLMMLTEVAVGEFPEREATASEAVPIRWLQRRPIERSLRELDLPKKHLESSDVRSLYTSEILQDNLPYHITVTTNRPRIRAADLTRDVACMSSALQTTQIPSSASSPVPPISTI